jgi:hypothetical protein
MSTLTPEQLQERYSAIELLYSESRWPEVLAASEALLAELPTEPGEPLRPRVELVLAHTLLYGQSDPQGAEARYRLVLELTGEAVLRDLAEQGLLRCETQRRRLEGTLESDAVIPEESIATAGADQPQADRSGAGEDWDPTLASAATAAAARAAMPWLGDATAADADAADESIELGALGAQPLDRVVRAAQISGLQGETGEETGEVALEAEGSLDTDVDQSLSLLRERQEQMAALRQPVEPGVRQPRVLDLPGEDEEAALGMEGNLDTDVDQSLSLLRERQEQMAALRQPVEGAEPAAAGAKGRPDADGNDTLALLRKPQEIQQGNVSVLDDPADGEGRSAGAALADLETPPLSPEEMEELARGLLEVVLR